MSRSPREALLADHERLCKAARALMAKKNHDYAGSAGGQPFANFERVEAMGICSTERGFLVRLVDKLIRLSSFSDSGRFEVSDESFTDTVLDIINYSILLCAYHEQCARRDKLRAEECPNGETRSQKHLSVPVSG